MMNNSINQENQQQSKRYYWLKLQDNFFERDEIKIIEAMPNGKDYILFYLKVMLKSINENGRLIFKNTIPYSNEMLATITGTNIDVVRVAIDTFIGLGLMNKLDDGALFMHEVHKLLGSETEYAQRKREYRQEKTMSKLLEDKNKTKKDIVRDNVRSEKDNVLQEKEIEIDTEKESPYSPPEPQNSSLGGDGGGGGFECDWLNSIKQHNYQFSKEQVTAITAWAKYKADKHETISLQQIELTLKQLNAHQLANQNIVYLIETSISRGYKGIMEPTKGSLSPESPPPTGRYPSAEYITPETQSQKIELRNYLERCYMRDKVDPRTKEPLTKEQIILFLQHLKRMEKQRISFTDFIYQTEVMTGICLLEQPIAA